MCPAAVVGVQLQDLHSWSFGRPDLKALKEKRDKANSEEIPLEGLSNGLAVQELDATNDRCYNSHVALLIATSPLGNSHCIHSIAA